MQMFALVKKRLKTFPCEPSKEHYVRTSCEGSQNKLVGKFLKILKKLFSKSFLSGCGQSPRPFREPPTPFCRKMSHSSQKKIEI